MKRTTNPTLDMPLETALDTTEWEYSPVPLVQTYSPLERYKMMERQERQQARKRAREARRLHQQRVREARRRQAVAGFVGVLAITTMVVIIVVGTLTVACLKWSDENVARAVATRQDFPRSYDLEGSLVRAGATDYEVGFDEEGYGTTVRWRLGSYQYELFPTYDTLMIYRDAEIPDGALGWLFAPLLSLAAEKVGEWHPTLELRTSASENGYFVGNGEDWYVGNGVTITSAMLAEIQQQINRYC